MSQTPESSPVVKSEPYQSEAELEEEETRPKKKPRKTKTTTKKTKTSEKKRASPVTPPPSTEEASEAQPGEPEEPIFKKPPPKKRATKKKNTAVTPVEAPPTILSNWKSHLFKTLILAGLGVLTAIVQSWGQEQSQEQETQSPRSQKKAPADTLKTADQEVQEYIHSVVGGY